MLRRVLSYILGVLLLCPFAAAIAGGIRYHLYAGLILSLSVAIPCSLLLWIKEKPKFLFNSWSQIFLCTGLFAGFVLRLRNSQLGNLVNYGCADAANHYNLYKSFVLSDPQSYQGFNALYLTWYVLENIFSFESSYALYLALLFPVFSISYLLAYFFKYKGKLSLIAYILTLLVISELVLLPIIHYNQADGYLAHLFSVAIFLPTLFFGLEASYPAFLFMLIACRFSYGLQIPELLAASGSVLILRAFKAESLKPKIALFSTGSVCFIACAATITKLLQIFEASGSIISQNLDYAFAAQIAGLALLLICYFKREAEEEFPFKFITAFLLTSCAVQAIWLLITKEPNYYFSKLFLYTSLSLAILAIKLSSDLAHNKSAFMASAWLLLLSFSVVAQRPYLPSYLERVQPSGEYKLISPLIDSKVRGIVDEVLIKENKTFGGYFTSRWGQFSFFNALYGQPSDFYRFHNPPLSFERNSCIFWSKNSNDLPRLEKYGAYTSIEWFKAMNAREDAKEVKYTSPWAGRQLIKYICFD